MPIVNTLDIFNISKHIRTFTLISPKKSSASSSKLYIGTNIYCTVLEDEENMYLSLYSLFVLLLISSIVRNYYLVLVVNIYKRKIYCMHHKNKKTTIYCGPFVWCRWWESNPHVVAYNRF